MNDNSSQARSYPGNAEPLRGEGLAADLWHYWEILRRRWWLVAGAVVVAVGLAWWSQHDAVPKYSAEVLLQQRQETPVVSQALLQNGPQDEFGSQVEIIRSRAILAPVVDSLGLQLKMKTHRNERTRIFSSVAVDPAAAFGSYTLVDNSSGWVLKRPKSGRVIATADRGDTLKGPDFYVVVSDSASASEPVEFSIANRQAAVTSLQSGLQIEQGKGPDLITISYRDADPKLAADVVNTVASSYQDYRATLARNVAGRRRQVIEGQLVELADSLRQVQGHVQDYQQSRQLLDPGAEGSAVMSAVLKTQDDLRSLEFQQSRLKALEAGLSGSQGTDVSDVQQLMALGGDLVPAANDLYSRLQNLLTQRSQLTASRFGYTANEPQVQVVDSLIASTRRQMRGAVDQALNQVAAQIQSTQQHLRSLQGQVTALPAKSAELSRLTQRADAVQGVFDNLVQKYYEAQIQEGVETGDVDIVDPAPVPLFPDPSNLKLSLIIAALVGLVLGGMGAVTVDQLDPNIHDARDAEALTGLQLVGTVPTLKRGKNGQKSRDDLIGKEAFRGLRTNLQFARSGERSVVAVVSAAPGAGKSTVASNLALTLAEQGKKVVLVDADLRRPQVHKIVKVSQSPGLVELLDGSAATDEVIKTTPIHARLSAVTSGYIPNDPPEVVGSERFTELLAELRSRFDVVVLDTPPLLAVSDAVMIATLADGTLVVARAEQTNRKALSHAVEQLRRVDANLLGLVLNGVEVGSPDGYYGYYYYHEYYTDAPDRKKSASEERRLISKGRASKGQR
ncbi:MAG: polysaccharide biosynthesis tyrosine autokinase [Candidatus Palauibacterales bacterium]|nr:polysaccharide biosynthesis tyrosine autokinase [Candidatus Palauibacterales bacterium]